MMTDVDDRLTAAELAQLWNTFMNNKMYKCVLLYCENKVEDQELTAIIKNAIQICDGIISEIIAIYEKENHPIPIAMNEDEDVNISAPKLYSEILMLSYIHDMTRYGMIGYSTAVSIAVREDVEELFNKALQEDIQLYKRTLSLLQSKGTYYRSPSIPIPEKIEIADKGSYLSGFVGKQRALTVIEVMNLYNDMQRNALGKAVFLGLSQTVASNDIEKFLLKCVNHFNKNVEKFANTLIKDNISTSPTLDSEVLHSTTPPFSERLMLGQVVMFIATLTGYYGTALGTVSRRDLGEIYAAVLVDTVELSNQAAKLLIKYGWLEQAPQSVDHKFQMK